MHNMSLVSSIATMKVLGSILLFHIISSATAGIIIPSTKIIEGPSSKTTLVGPDGSVITSVAQGAKIVADDNSILVAGPDTAAELKSADDTAVIQPIVAAPSTVLESHVIAPAIAAKTIFTDQKHFVPDGTISLASGQLHPAYTPLLKSHIVPVVAEQPAVVKYEPLVAHEAIAHVGTKTSVSEQSQTIVHPHSIRKTYVEAAPLVSNDAVIIQNEPLVAAEVVPAIETKAAVITSPKLAAVHSDLVLHTAPVVAEQITHEVIGAKTTVSEHGSSIHHPSNLLRSHQAIVAHPVPVIAKTVIPSVGHLQTVYPGAVSHAQPIVSVKAISLEAIHPEYLSVDAVHSVPVIGARHTVSENSQTLISHSW